MAALPFSVACDDDEALVDTAARELSSVFFFLFTGSGSDLLRFFLSSLDLFLFS